MKLLYVTGDGDYNAVEFEDAGYDKPDKLKDLWQKAWKESNHRSTVEVTEDGETYELEIEAYQFGPVDPHFISFVTSSVQDYDQSKCSNFYIVED